MGYDIIGKNPKVAILVPLVQKTEILKHYLSYVPEDKKNFMLCDIYIDKTKKKTTNKDIKEYLNSIIPELMDNGIKLLVVTNPEYFKVLTKSSKTDSTVGNIVPTILGDKLYTTYCPHYGRLFFDPDKVRTRIQLSFESVVRWLDGDKSSIGDNIIKFCEYPKTNKDILSWLDTLTHIGKDLTCDIECFSLKHYDAGIGTITFCWSQSEGIAFPVDYQQDQTIQFNKEVRDALKNFFINFKHKLIYHNISFDVYVLVYQLFMNHLLDQEGLLYGLDVMLKNWDCTQLITYLATNSCAGNELGLKAQAQEYSGNYALEEINDITKVPLDALLKYNLIDGLSTWYVYNKNQPIMVNDNQTRVYNTIFKPAVKDIIQMQLTGLPINMDKVKSLNSKLNKEVEDIVLEIRNTDIIKNFIKSLKNKYVIKKNQEYKKKVITLADVNESIIDFNPNSDNQLRELFYSKEFLNFTPIDFTKSKQPATGADTIEKLLVINKSPEINKLLKLIIEFKAIIVILNTFIPAFLNAKQGKDGWHYLFGNFKLGGTQSGRISSNSPNLQNIPSSASTKEKARLVKMVKNCIEPPKGWLFIGVDFDSLEDKISALTTRDKNKLKVYTDHYDGHCLRAYAYFMKNMVDIEMCPEEAIAYSVNIDNNTIYFHSEELIVYLGEALLGKDLYQKLKGDAPNVGDR